MIPPQTIRAIAVNGNNVYVGGFFNDLGGNPLADNIGYWDGCSWNALDSGLNNTVNTLNFFNGHSDFGSCVFGAI